MNETVQCPLSASERQARLAAFETWRSDCAVGEAQARLEQAILSYLQAAPEKSRHDPH